MLEFIKKMLGGGSDAAIKKLEKIAQQVEALTPILTELKDKSNSAVFPLNKNGATWLMTFYDGMNLSLIHI